MAVLLGPIRTEHGDFDLRAAKINADAIRGHCDFSHRTAPPRHGGAMAPGLTRGSPGHLRKDDGTPNPPPNMQYPRCLLNGRGQRLISAMSEILLDVKGLNCPLPVLRANRSLRSMEPGARLRVLATDRASVADFQAFCRETGHALLAWSEENGVFSFLIRRRETDPPAKEE